MFKSIFLFSMLLLLFACSGEDTGELLVDFPHIYQIDTVNTLGTNTYQYTDTIIYKTESDLIDDINERGARYVDSILFSNDTSLSNFFIQSISFNELGSVTVNGRSGSMNTDYTELSGIGRIDAFGGLGFKINPNLQELISCFTITSSRTIDSLFEGSFLPGLDTLYNADSSLVFQLNIVEGSDIDIRYCDPFTEDDLVADFSARYGLKNDDRIVTHRTDFIFKKN